MRPRFMNRGSRARRDRDPERDLASMRPRFMNRGSGQYAHRWTSPVRASMRPRFMNRGSRDAARIRGLVLGGFNEAPIHESGK